MADNLPVSGGTGYEVATDEIAGAHYQKVKIVTGADGVANALGNTIPMSEGALIPNGVQADQRLSVDGTAVGVQFTAFHADTTYVLFSVEDYDVRFTLDNSAPTSVNGHILRQDSWCLWSKNMASAAKFIRITSTATIHASQMVIA